MTTENENPQEEATSPSQEVNALPQEGMTLAQLVETAKSTRLTAPQEKEAIALLKTSLLGKKADIVAAIDSLINLHWMVAVNAVVEAWPEMKTLGKKQVPAALATHQSEQGRRVRLSIGRGLLPLDAPVALKLIAAACADMIPAEGNEISGKDRQAFANVLIGKGKPWLLHLALAELKADEAAPLIRVAVATCLTGQCPPLTLLSVLRWVNPVVKLADLPADLLEEAAKFIKRWPTKLQVQLKADIAELPPVIEESLKPRQQPQQQPPAKAVEKTETDEEEDEEDDLDDDLEEELAGQNPEKQHEERNERGNRRDRNDRRDRGRKEKQQPYQPQQQQRGGQQGRFDLAATLRQIESHVQGLQAELNQTKAQLKEQRDSRGKGRGRERTPEPLVEPHSPEELQRHNEQLQETIAELRTQLEELASNHEDIAASMQAHEENPVVDGREQFKALIAIKLKEEYAEFQMLGRQPADEVFREHYRLLLEDVFNELEKQGVNFKEG